MDIIDFRLRPPTGTFLRCGFYASSDNPFEWHSNWPASIKERSMPLLKQEMKGADINRAVIWARSTYQPKHSTDNDDVAHIRDENEEFIAAFGGVCPTQETMPQVLAETERVIKMLHMKGVTLEPSFGMRPLTGADDPMLYPLYELLQDLDSILALTISRGSPPDQTLALSNPEQVDRVARDFPRLKIVISHSFWPWVEHSCGLAFRRENVYLLPDLYGMAMPGHLSWVEAANTYLQDRMLFGSAYPYLGAAEMASSYLNLPYKDSVLEKVMCRNAERLLGLRAD